MNVSTDRRLMALLSLTAADALGAATEFSTPAALEQKFGGRLRSYVGGSVFGFAPGEATDDSQMVAATLLGYARQDGLGGILAALCDWAGTHPPDVGALTRSALTSGRLSGGVEAWAASHYQSAGNGGLMRIAATWLAGYSAAVLTQQSVLVTGLTHADPRCIYASVFFTAWLEALSQGETPEAAAQAALDVMDRTEARSILLGGSLFGIEDRAAFAAFGEIERAARAEVRRRVHAGLGAT
ncbi:ADP-ribosylglycohydrolase family protein [Deinococcus lacus]|uniref:ADP-ribosylglycohydrolase family protein n=1 Tax=Deinococcus lacus TaxID=392561 RepID=A0ABW1YDN8_9DEIO